VFTKSPLASLGNTSGVCKKPTVIGEKVLFSVLILSFLETVVDKFIPAFNQSLACVDRFTLAPDFSKLLPIIKPSCSV
jgi:hypothetical protein